MSGNIVKATVADLEPSLKHRHTSHPISVYVCIQRECGFVTFAVDRMVLDPEIRDFPSFLRCRFRHRLSRVGVTSRTRRACETQLTAVAGRSESDGYRVREPTGGFIIFVVW